MSLLTEAIVGTILGAEQSPTRFEHYCNELVGEVEGGVPIVGTSRSWDLGRDGRARHQGIYTLVSLSGRVDEKARRDVMRSSAHLPSNPRVFFCSNQELSEKKVMELTAELQALLPAGAVVDVYGRLQLAQLTARKPGPFERSYTSELADVAALLAGRSGGADEAGLRALHLALSTAASSSSAEIRNDLTRGAIRQVLADRTPRNLPELCRDISALFRLNRVIAAEALKPQLRSLQSEGEVKEVNGRFSLTTRGEGENQRQSEVAVDRYLDGREAIRKALESSLGYRLADEHYERMWRSIKDSIANLFFARGQEMFELACEILRCEPGKPSQSSVGPAHVLVEEIAAAAAATCSKNEPAEEVIAAVKDMFDGAESHVQEWLASLAASFLALCSLGLEEESGKAIASVLSKTELVLDTDVVLSLLCDAEPDHQGVEAIVLRWKAIGGRILVPEEVLREAAHHAWIADVDFQSVQAWLPGEPDDRRQLIENAFVRTFAEHLGNNRARKQQWKTYIGQFAGKHKGDWSGIAADLFQDRGLDALPARDAEDQKTEESVRAFLVSSYRKEFGERGRKWEDKARRDASIYAAIQRRRRESRNAGVGRTCILVTSARRLFQVEVEFREAGDPHLVLPISAVLYLLTLVPGVSVGLTALRAFLFDGRRVRFSSDLERVLLRALRESSEVRMPWAKGRALVRECRGRLLEDARRRGEAVVSPEDRRGIEDRALDEPNLGRTAELLRDSLDAVAADKRLEAENIQLQARVKQLTEELVAARRRRERKE